MNQNRSGLNQRFPNYYQELNAIPMEDEEARVRTIKLARAQGTVKKLEMEMSDTFAALFGG